MARRDEAKEMDDETSRERKTKKRKSPSDSNSTSSGREEKEKESVRKRSAEEAKKKRRKRDAEMMAVLLMVKLKEKINGPSIRIKVSTSYFHNSIVLLSHSLPQGKILQGKKKKLGYGLVSSYRMTGRPVYPTPPPPKKRKKLHARVRDTCLEFTALCHRSSGGSG